MVIDATAVANYFIELSQRDGKELTLLGLVKRVYIAHGFSLAIFNRSLLNEQFDKVEAWKYGPVIPSVYHTFKHYHKSDIKELASIAIWSEETQDLEFSVPKLEDSVAQQVCDMVWLRYFNFTGSDLVNLTHREGTPWSMCYVEGANCTIPDEYTRLFYKRVVNSELNIDNVQE